MHECRPRWRPWLGLFLVALTANGVTAAVEEIGERPHLAVPADQLIREFENIPVDEEHGIQVLLEQAEYTLDDTGKALYRFRMIYRVDSPGSVRGWSRISRSWQSWYQERPRLRARVILPDGSEHRLDPQNVGEYSEGDEGPDVYGDTKTLRGPLPAVDIGAIVEESHEVRDLAPAFAAGMIRSFIFGNQVPTRYSELIVDAPVDLPLRHVSHRLPRLRLEQSEEAGRRRLRFTHGPLPAWNVDVRLAPGDVARRPAVRFSTGESWGALAAEYAAVVDGRLAEADVRKTFKRAAGKEKDRDAMIERLLAYVHEQVRYTGVEFGERGLIPEVPARTLERRFGDCKDKAALLVALLRQGGFDANVALLNTGPGNDVDPDLPGISRFDHAIVHVAGTPEIWIDATDPFSRVGQLPLMDQGRLALIAKTGTTGLVRIPKSGVEGNVRRERRQVYLAADGPARIVETTEVTGAFEQSFRRSFSTKNDAELKEQLESYVEGNYLAEGVEAFEVAKPDDLSVPMTLRIEAEQCSRAVTDARRAAVAIGVGALVRDLPAVLKTPPDPEDPGPPREDPVELHDPFTVEIRYEIHPPPGYAMLTLPDSQRRQLGPATLSEEYSVRDDGVVVGDLRFDSGPTVYSVEQVVETQQTAAEFFEKQMPQVIFHQVGESHLEAGRLREALREFRRLVELEPEQARHRTRVARAYLEAGLGGHARREARRAVQLAPDSMTAHRTLGIILAHDELGRKFVKGFDRAGAEQALRSARKLDDQDFVTRGELAILLEHEEDGTRYESPDLDQAIDEYMALRADLKAEGLTSNLMRALMYADRFEEMRATWKEAPREASRDGLYLAAVAAMDGAQAAVDESTRIAGGAEAQRTSLQVAGEALASIRRYSEAATLMGAGARGASGALEALNRAEVYRRVQRHDPAKLDRATPVGVVQAFFTDAILGRDVMAHFAAEVVAVARAEELEEFVDLVSEGMIWALTQEDIAERVALDTFLSLSTFSVDGNEGTGWRVTMRLPPGPGGAAEPTFFYLVPSTAGPRLVCLGPTQELAGALLFEWVENGRLERAAQWLDWLAQDALVESSDGELDVQPITLIWSGEGPRGPERMRVAAAGLMLGGFTDPRLDELSEASRSLPPDGMARRGVELARMQAAVAVDAHEICLEAARFLRTAYPRSDIPFQAEWSALVRLERFEEAEALVARRLKERPNDSATASLHADLPHLRGQLDEHRKRLEQLLDAGRATEFDLNNLAWLDIVQDRVDDRTLSLSQQSVAQSNYSSWPSLHTLATVYAELGQVAEARDVLLALLSSRLVNDLEHHDWYVLGRIAEQYGVPDAALDAYERVERPGAGIPEVTSTFVLARRAVERVRAGEREAKASPGR